MQQSSNHRARQSVSGWRGFVVFGLLIMCPVMDALAGVLVSPSVVFISEKGRTGRMTVHNPTDKPREISISFSFGLPESDSLGNVNIFLRDTAVTDPRSALGWIKAFPRRLILPPNASQVVRFVAHPPKDLPDGEYWARVIVESQEGTTSLPVPSAEDEITTKLNMIMRTAIMLKYRTGDLVASLQLENAEAREVDSSVEVMVSMKNEGNVSYVGILKCRLLDAADKEIAFNRTQLAVYHDLMRRVDMRIGEGEFLRPYKVEVSISTRGRKDIPAEDMIYGNEIFYTLNPDE
jgi:P pilus assembly chaperone PapD